MGEYWQSFVNFLVEWDFLKILEAVRNLDPMAVVKSAVVWAVGVPLLAFIIWRKHYKLIVLGITFVLFLVLLHFTLVPPGETIPLDSILTFIGGTVVLIGVNLYFLFIRE